MPAKSMSVPMFGILLVVGASAAADLPVYCRLLQVGLEAAVQQPIVEDVSVSVTEHVPVLGDIDVSMSRLELSSIKMVSCDAFVDKNGVFDVKMSRLDIGLASLGWRYAQRSWPHTSDNGNATGATSVSFHVGIDMDKDKEQLVQFQLGEIDVSLGAQHHSWLTAAMMKLVKFLRPLVSEVVQLAAKKVMHDSLSEVRQKGGCAFLGGALKQVSFLKFGFTSWEPIRVHVPVIGDVDISVNSTHIGQPTSMECQHVSFDGERLVAHIENVPFDAGFKWAYRKVGSSFWHNSGTGKANVVAGTMVNIDLITPKSTGLKIDVPVLKLDLHADADAWLYKALTFAMVPLVRHSLNLFGGEFLTYELRKCLEDPSCPHLSSASNASEDPQWSALGAPRWALDESALSEAVSQQETKSSAKNEIVV
jgi:hypothetical protein